MKDANQLLQKETQQLRQRNERDCAEILARAVSQAEDEARAIIANANKEEDTLYKILKMKVEKERESVINEARLKGENEAKSLLENARNNAGAIENETREKALKAAQEDIQRMMAEARKEVEWQAATIVTEARVKAREINKKT